jgi:hypothetical protein
MGSAKKVGCFLKIDFVGLLLLTCRALFFVFWVVSSALLIGLLVYFVHWLRDHWKDL